MKKHLVPVGPKLQVEPNFQVESNRALRKVQKNVRPSHHCIILA